MNNRINLHRIEDTRDLYLPHFEELYVRAFPSEERQDLPNLRDRIAGDGRFYIHALLRDANFIGLLSWWDFDSFLYGEHFATLPEVRGQGLGAAALQYLTQDTAHRPVLLEVEPPVDELTTRRINFYRRMGFSLLDTPYIQPPYRPEDRPTPLQLMSYGVIEEHELPTIISTIHREVYKM